MSPAALFQCTGIIMFTTRSSNNTFASQPACQTEVAMIPKSPLICDPYLKRVYAPTTDFVLRHRKGREIPLTPADVERLEWDRVEQVQIEHRRTEEGVWSVNAYIVFGVSYRHRYHPTLVNLEDVTAKYSKAVQVIERFIKKQ